MNIKLRIIEAVQIGQDALDRLIFELKQEINNIEYLKVLIVLSKIINDVYKETESIDGVTMFLDEVEPYLLDNEKISEFIMNGKGDFIEVENEIYHFFSNNYEYQFASSGNSNSNTKTKSKVKTLTNGHSLLDDTGNKVLVKREEQKIKSKIIEFPGKMDNKKAAFAHPIILGLITAAIEISTVVYILMK